MPRRKIRQAPANSRLPMRIALREVCAQPFNIVAGINFVIMTIYYLLFVTGPAYVMSVHNLSLSAAGFSSGIMVLGCLAGRFISGNLILLAGARTLLFTGLTLNAISIFLFNYVPGTASIFADRALTGIGVGIVGTVTATIVARVVPNGIKAFGISIFSLGTALALALGPFFGIILSQIMDYPTMTTLLAIIAMTVILPAIFLKNDASGAKHHKRPLFNLNNYIDPRVARFSLVPLAVFLGYGCLQAFIASFARGLGIYEYAGIFFIVYAIAAIGTRPFVGRLMDNRTENTVIYPILLSIAAGLALLGVSTTGWMLLLSAVLLGFGYGNYQSVGQAVAILLVTPSRYSQATSTFFIFMDFGIGLGPYIFGQIAPAAGYSGMYLILALIVLLCIAPYHLLHGRYLRRGVHYAARNK